MTDENGTIIGTTKISHRYRMSLIVDVQEEFREMGVDPQVGDTVVFRRRDDDILIEVA